MNRFIILSGPSCVGKGPLYSAFARFYPDHVKELKKVILYNSRAPRPGESDGIDYHFRPRNEIEDFRKHSGYLVFEVRGDLQALDLEKLESSITEGDTFFEGNPFVSLKMMNSSFSTPLKRISVFLSPLSREEIIFLKNPDRRVNLPEFITDLMRRKLLRRTKKQKGILSLKDLEDIERRASSAYSELSFAWQFDSVLPNHDGEDSENWSAFYYPVGDAFKTLKAFVEIFEERQSPLAEKWDKDLIDWSSS